MMSERVRNANYRLAEPWESGVVYVALPARMCPTWALREEREYLEALCDEGGCDEDAVMRRIMEIDRELARKDRPSYL